MPCQKRCFNLVHAQIGSCWRDFVPRTEDETVGVALVVTPAALGAEGEADGSVDVDASVENNQGRHFFLIPVY